MYELLIKRERKNKHFKFFFLFIFKQKVVFSWERIYESYNTSFVNIIILNFDVFVSHKIEMYKQNFERFSFCFVN